MLVFVLFNRVGGRFGSLMLLNTAFTETTLREIILYFVKVNIKLITEKTSYS